jgi:hypothetical protein
MLINISVAENWKDVDVWFTAKHPDDELIVFCLTFGSIYVEKKTDF